MSKVKQNVTKRETIDYDLERVEFDGQMIQSNTLKNRLLSMLSIWKYMEKKAKEFFRVETVTETHVLLYIVGVSLEDIMHKGGYEIYYNNLHQFMMKPMNNLIGK